MKFGLAIFATEDTPHPERLGRMAEEREFESLFFPDHTHIPASRQSRAPEGDVLPDFYRLLYDPFVALSFAAASTDHLVIGNGICLVTERDPIITAKEAASLDRLSGGRYIFGVGAGWNREEMANHGTDPRTRFQLMGERVRAIREIWSSDEASFHGDYVDFDRIWQWPKPLQRPGPPVLVGGEGRTVIDRVMEYGDGWMPNRPPEFAEILPQLKELQLRARNAGRGPMPVTMSDAPMDQSEIEAYPELGIERCVYWLPSVGEAELATLMDEITDFVAGLRDL